MDDIADKLGCSKKTLYVFFENRKDLVLKVISNDMKKHEVEINNVIAKKLHPIEEILSLNVIAINKLKTCHSSFQYDLKKYYPQSWNIFDKKNKHGGVISNALKIASSIFEIDLSNECAISL